MPVTSTSCLSPDAGSTLAAAAAAVGVSVLDLDTAGFYRPKTKETREAYEALLAVIHGQFGEQPQVCLFCLPWVDVDVF